MAGDPRSRRRVRVVDVGEFWPATGIEDDLLRASQAADQPREFRGGPVFDAADLERLAWHEAWFGRGNF